MKTIIVCSILLVLTASAEILELDNNLIEYGEITRPGQIISLPYPYQVVEPAPAAPAYSDTHSQVIVPTTTEVIVAPSGLFSTAISCTFGAVKAFLVFLLTNGPALIIGIVAALGICKLTSLCDSKVTIYEAEMELRSLATSERLSRAANFVREAVKKYNEMQKN